MIDVVQLIDCLNLYWDCSHFQCTYVLLNFTLPMIWLSRLEWTKVSISLWKGLKASVYSFSSIRYNNDHLALVLYIQLKMIRLPDEDKNRAEKLGLNILQIKCGFGQTQRCACLNLYPYYQRVFSFLQFLQEMYLMQISGTIKSYWNIGGTYRFWRRYSTWSVGHM